MRKCIVFRKNIAICPCMEGRCTTQWRIQDFPDVGRQLSGGCGAPTYEFSKFSQKLLETRLHSSRMHTARLLTVSPSMHWGGWVSLPGGSPCQNGGLPCQGVSLPGGSALPEGGSALPEGGSALPGGCLLVRGVSACQGGWYPSMWVLLRRDRDILARLRFGHQRPLNRRCPDEKYQDVNNNRLTEYPGSPAWTPATSKSRVSVRHLDTRDLLVAGVRISISPKYLYLYLELSGSTPAYTEADPTSGQNSWHILKILPCPKLRLRAVIKEFGSGGVRPSRPP